MDYTLSVMLPPKGDTTLDRSPHTKMPVLGISCVYPLQLAMRVTNPVLGLLHVRNCPFKTAKEFSEIITQPDDASLLIGIEPIIQHRAKRLWEADVTKFPEKYLVQLLENRECDIQWEEFVAIYKNRADDTPLDTVIKARVEAEDGAKIR